MFARLLVSLSLVEPAPDAGTPTTEPPQLDVIARAEADSVRAAFDSHRRTLLDEPLLRSFYEARGWAPAFATPDGLTWEGLTLVEHLPVGVRHGIDPDWLGLDEIRASFRRLDSGAGGANAAAALEVELADALVRLAVKLRLGNAANAPIGEDPATWRSAGLLAILSATGEDLRDAIVALPPRLPAYRDLVEALDRYRAIQEAGYWPRLAGPLDEHASIEQINVVRARLGVEGYLPEGTSGPWDDTLIAALRRYQAAHHVETEALLDAATVEELNQPVHERVAQIIVSLDRMRDTPVGVDGHGESVRVNVAGFYVEVWDGDERLFHTRAIVGRTEGGNRNLTPLFSDSMERIELNPVWYPPPRLARNLREDPSRGIVMQGGRLIQLPGPSNALGRVKFMFPNTHDVYLHDTSQRQLFDETIRAYSSGCVRIDRPLDLAALLISRDQERDLDETRGWIDEVMDTTRTQVVRLQRPLPVHIEYYTAYVADDGLVEFYSDIYDLDRRAIREVSRRRDVSWRID